MARRNTKRTVFAGFGLALAAGLVALAYGQRQHFSVLQPRGTIAHDERGLMVFATVLSLFVVLPVLAMLFFIAWHYREGNKKATRQLDWDHSRTLETIWWGIPCLIIVVLACVTWTSSHSLDPSKPIASVKPPLNIEVVALQWKWLFIYPDQGIASVNYLRVPDQTPLNFHITSDAPMNSFWIPQLGGQVYAMSGMETTLHLMADAPGTYQGVSANLSGSGFAGMRFTVESTNQDDFTTWVATTHTSGNRLTTASYNELAKPSSDTPATSYAAVSDGLYDSIISKYNGGHTMAGMGNMTYQEQQ